MYVTPSGPQSIGGVIDDAIRLYRHSFSRCWLLAFLPAVALGAWGVAVMRYVPDYGVPHFPITQPLAVGHALPGVMVGEIAVLSLLAAGFQGAVAALQAAVARSDDSFTLGRAFATAFLRLPTLILSTILLYLVIGGAIALVIFVVLLPLGILLNHLHLPMRAVAPAGVTVIVLVALLALMGRMQLFMAAIFIDRMGPLASLKASWRLTQGHWWRATAIMMTAFIMMMVLFLAVTVMRDLEGYLTHYGPIHRFLIAPLLVVLAYTALYPLAAAIWVAMYSDFKLRREGGDLAARVGALNSA